MYLCPSLKRVLLYLCIGCWGLCACDKYENDRDVFFIQFDSASVKSDLNNAKGDYKITDLWIYNNYQFIGVYPLGSKVTVTFVTQPSTLTLLAGFLAVKLGWVPGDTVASMEYGVGRRWVPLLGILGGSVMGTSGAHNPTHTMQALAWRTADHVIKDWKTISA